MTIEQKAKAYDKAIEKIKYVMEHGVSPTLNKEDLEDIFTELQESEDERIRRDIISYIQVANQIIPQFQKDNWLAWLEKQGEKPTIPKWKYKKDHTPLLRDSLILNKYGCVAKSPSGAIVSDVWVIDYDELAKLPKEEFEKQAPKTKWTEEGIREAQLDYWRSVGGKEWHGVPVQETIAWLEKQVEQKPKKISIWKHWKGGIAGGAEDGQIFLIKIGRRYSISSCLGSECDYIELSELDEIMREEKQEKPKWSEEDERERKRVVGLLEGWLSTFKETCYTEDCKFGIEWLKSLKKRMEE